MSNSSKRYSEEIQRIFAIVHCCLINIVREIVDIVASVQCWSNVGISTPTFLPPSVPLLSGLLTYLKVNFQNKYNDKSFNEVKKTAHHAAFQLQIHINFNNTHCTILQIITAKVSMNTRAAKSTKWYILQTIDARSKRQ